MEAKKKSIFYFAQNVERKEYGYSTASCVSHSQNENKHLFFQTEGKFLCSIQNDS